MTELDGSVIPVILFVRGLFDLLYWIAEAPEASLEDGTIRGIPIS